MPMSRNSAKSERLKMYAQWMHDDADGIAHNIDAEGLTREEQFAALQEVKLKLSEAISKIDGAIVANRLTERSVA